MSAAAATAPGEQLVRALGRLLAGAGPDEVLAAALQAHDQACTRCATSEARCVNGQRLADAAATMEPDLPGYPGI